MVQDSEEQKLIDQLRKEASDVKSCFTNFSFQALALSATVLGVTFGAMEEFYTAVLAPTPVIVLLMIVCRIGIFKYSSANRHHAYELHLARMANLTKKSKQFLNRDIRLIRWEEAMRAWRVVQTTVFSKIYKTPETTRVEQVKFLNLINHLRWSMYGLTKDTKQLVRTFKNNVKDGIDNKSQDEYPWFMPKLLTQVKLNSEQVRSFYHAGTYLRNMMSILLMMQYLLISPLAILIYKKFTGPGGHIPILWSSLFFILLFAVFLRHIRVNRRREILENEMLSIHSSGIMWHAVVLAHYLALDKTHGLYEHYTEYLIDIAQDIADHVFSIHKWIERGHAKILMNPTNAI